MRTKPLEPLRSDQQVTLRFDIDSTWGGTVSVLQFIEAIVATIAWPAAALGMTAVLRGPIAGILPPSPAWKYKDREFDVQRELSAIGTRVQAASSGARPAGADHAGDLLAEVGAVAAISPLAALPLAWIAVESEVGKSVERLGVQVRSLRLPAQAIQALVAEGYIDNETERTLNRLRQLRNKAVHAAYTRIHVSRGNAEEYARLAAEVISILRRLQKRDRGDAT